MRKIYTHNGEAHIDEIIACAIVYANHYTMDIERISPQEAGVKTTHNFGQDDDILLIDVGMRYNSPGYFDGHSVGCDECSAELVAKRYAPELLEDMVWSRVLKSIRAMNTEDPRDLIQQLEPHEHPTYVSKRTEYLTDTVANPLLVMGQALCKQFEEDPAMVATMVAHIIREKLDFIFKIRGSKTWLADHMELDKVGDIKFLYVKDIYPGEDAEFNEVQSGVIDAEKVDVACTRDRQSGGIKLCRTHWGKDKLDFAKAHPEHEIFSHEDGSLLIYRPECQQYNEWGALINQARV